MSSLSETKLKDFNEVYESVQKLIPKKLLRYSKTPKRVFDQASGDIGKTPKQRYRFIKPNISKKKSNFRLQIEDSLNQTFKNLYINKAKKEEPENEAIKTKSAAECFQLFQKQRFLKRCSKIKSKRWKKLNKQKKIASEVNEAETTGEPSTNSKRSDSEIVIKPVPVSSMLKSTNYLRESLTDETDKPMEVNSGLKNLKKSTMNHLKGVNSEKEKTEKALRWNQWIDSSNIEQSSSEKIVNKKPVNPSEFDKNAHLIKNSSYLLGAAPHPFSSNTAYNEANSQPLGVEWNTVYSFKQLCQ